jgi:hypothetical protein
VNDEPQALRILSLRVQIAELGGTIRQLQQSGMDSTTAQLLISRKRVELECLMRSQSIGVHSKGQLFCRSAPK